MIHFAFRRFYMFCLLICAFVFNPNPILLERLQKLLDDFYLEFYLAKEKVTETTSKYKKEIKNKMHRILTVNGFLKHIYSDINLNIFKEKNDDEHKLIIVENNNKNMEKEVSNSNFIIN